MKLLEVCVDSLASARAAKQGGADRLEFCSALAVGGLTPYADLLRQIKAELDLPVRCLMRPRAGDFLYTRDELELLCRQIETLRSAGADGFVIGALTPEGALDLSAMRTLLDACGGVKDGTYKLIAGGPMMGMAQYTADIPVAKGTGAILAFCEKEEQTVEHPQCIRCGKCVAACPVHLEPLFMYQYAETGMVDELNEAHIMDCMECGACSYICPARMHLTHMFKTGKQLVKDKMAADKAAAEAKKAAQEQKEAVNK